MSEKPQATATPRSGGRRAARSVVACRRATVPRPPPHCPGLGRTCPRQTPGPCRLVRSTSRRPPSSDSDRCPCRRPHRPAATTTQEVQPPGRIRSGRHLARTPQTPNQAHAIASHHRTHSPASWCARWPTAGPAASASQGLVSAPSGRRPGRVGQLRFRGRSGHSRRPMSWCSIP